MATWIALFQGMNVGGHNRLAMQALRDLLTQLGHSNVRTYIQSGNAVFESGKRSAAAIGDEIQRAIDHEHGFAPPVQMLKPEALRRAIDDNPFAKDVQQEKHLHLFFIDGKPSAGLAADLAPYAMPTETLAVIGKVLYLHAPDGLGRSKLGARIPKALALPATARNLRSARKIHEIASSG